MQPQVSYIAAETDKPFFFTPELTYTVDALSEALDQAQITLYPDATLKTNLLPTGILCASTFYSTYLFPAILRDPGCGFLTFKITLHKKPHNHWQHDIGARLHNFLNQACGNDKAKMIDLPPLDQMLQQGINGYALNMTEREKFFHQQFSVNTPIELSTKQRNALKEELCSVTNTLEIRTLDEITQPTLLSTHSINDEDLIGFIHSGSTAFPKILYDTFETPIKKYCHEHYLFTETQIEDGLFGIPIFTELGQKYQTWLNAAMNFALANRFATFLHIKQILEQHLPCEVSLMNDRMHAGLFTGKTSTDDHYFMSRGVQPIPAYNLRSPHNLTVHAGHRETIAALVSGTQKDQWTAHGSGQCILEDYRYEKHFDLHAIEHYAQQAKNAYYNTTPVFNELLPLTFNTLRAISSLEAAGICQQVAILSPLINIQGRLLL